MGVLNLGDDILWDQVISMFMYPAASFDGNLNCLLFFIKTVNDKKR